VRARREVDTVDHIQVVLMTVALVTLSFVVLMLLPPAIYKVYKTRDSTLDVFLSVPVARVQDIATAKLERLTQLGLAVVDVTGILVCSLYNCRHAHAQRTDAFVLLLSRFVSRRR